MNEDMKTAAIPPANVCPRCGTAFTCGMQAGWDECWCARLPPVSTIPDAATPACLCPTCLKALLDTTGETTRR